MVNLKPDLFYIFRNHFAIGLNCQNNYFAYQEVRNVDFSENLACFVFWKPPFWDSPFCIITDEFTELTHCQLTWDAMSKESKVHNLPNDFEIKLNFKV